jgi:hypothetical protein
MRQLALDRPGLPSRIWSKAMLDLDEFARP